MDRKLMQSLTFFLISMLTCQVSLGDGATVRGRFLQSEKAGHQVDFAKYKMKLVQLIQLPQPDLPEDWPKMSFEERQKWLNDFEQTEAGKQLIIKQDQMIAERATFDIKIEDSGKWVVFDVPTGQYGIAGGRIEKVKDGVKFAYELFGSQVEVTKDVDEVALDPIQVMVTPLLESGSQAPDFKVATHNNKGQMVLRHFSGKHLFIYFWSTESPPSVAFFGQVKQMYEQLSEKHSLELLNISLDAERKKAVDLVIQEKLKGRHGFTDGLEHPMIEAYGVRSFPSLWLISPDGKIELTNMDFRRISRAGTSSLAEIVDLTIQGKPLPAPIEQRPGSSSQGRTKQASGREGGQ